MPQNYDKLGGKVSSVRSWEAAGNRSMRYPHIERNSSFYPWFGHSNDQRYPALSMPLYLSVCLPATLHVSLPVSWVDVAFSRMRN